MCKGTLPAALVGLHSGTYEAVLCAGLSGEEEGSVVAEAWRVLRAGGKLVLRGIAPSSREALENSLLLAGFLDPEFVPIPGSTTLEVHSLSSLCHNSPSTPHVTLNF